MNKTKCVVTKVFPTLEDLKKVFFIDLDKQTITRISTNKTLSFHKDKYGYLKFVTSINSKKYHFKVHRLFFYWHNGYLPRVIDHIDRDRSNNKIENLRESNFSKNSRNSRKIRKKTSSRHKGVHYRKKLKRWVASLALNTKTIYIGCYLLEDDAGQAYNDKIRELGLEEVSVLNDTPQERVRKINLFNEKEESSYS